MLGIQYLRTLEWYLHEALLEEHPTLVPQFIQNTKYPPKLPDNYMEPMGIDYGRYDDWKTVDEMLMLVETSTKEVRASVEAESPPQ
jgi:hypothetical protein